MLVLPPRAVTPSPRASVLLRAVDAVACGWPSPAQDYYEGPISIDEALIKDHAATFIVRAAGTSMVNAGISPGDELLVDRSLTPRDGDIVVAILDGELTAKRLHLTGRGVILKAESDEHPDIVVPELAELRIFGVVTYAIHHLRQP